MKEKAGLSLNYSGGGRGPGMDYHNYPTAPRNYPLNYQQNSSRHPESQARNSGESYRGNPECYRNHEVRPRNHETALRNQEAGLRNQEAGPRNQEDFGSLGIKGPPSYRRSQLPPDTQQRHSTHFDQTEFLQFQRQPRTVDDYHHAYRGGYRPTGAEADGYTTDGSGSWRGQGAENPRYSREKEWLLPKYFEGNTYPRGDAGGGGGGSLEGEKAPFLTGVEPVRLTPSWEQSNLPKDELNFGTLRAYENFEMACTDPPKDRYRMVFLVLVLHGVGVLMPWNMFITAKNYFVEYKLNTDTEDVSTYATNFLPYIGYASQIPNVLFNWLNVFINMGGNLTSRIVWSLIVEVVVFVVTVVLAMIDSSQWPGVFFWITIASVVILNVAGGIYQNTVYGMAARLPFSYTGAVVLGNNISGTFTALINILAIALAPNIRTSAIYYFITALFVLLACFDTYFALPLNRFYRYHETKHVRTNKTVAERQKIRTPYWHIFKTAFPQLFNVFLVFFVTLAVFPAVLADTCRTEANFPISPKYYQAVTCFLTFNAFAMLGNMLPALITWPSPRYLCVPVILRLFLIPAFVLCHFYPVKAERIMPVLIDSDWAYWALSVVLGLTSGYYSSLAMMYCPRTVEPEHAPVAGMMGAASLMTGIFTGIVFQIVCTYAVTNITFEIPGYEFPFRNCTDRLV